MHVSSVQLKWAKQMSCVIVRLSWRSARENTCELLTGLAFLGTSSNVLSSFQYEKVADWHLAYIKHEPWGSGRLQNLCCKSVLSGNQP